ncbi:uncharacterized protein EV154DRAFT_565941 [Mucor mucedo]|uniref:uncharacterized protein n=1 Tax=Mucor mucedo TaxID=29922 RepID=UPI00221E569B|nr:uncharacterized protein EV154DRAFT_565941 [Mucor mucedo]KAI7888910.1 hypothetical protein EV154DRAFT_565941 [Mucor mucedo]
MSDIADKLLSAVMVVAPTIGYFDQYRIIYKSKTSLGFNSVTCAILCFAKLGKRFDITLLFQSIAMLVSMLVLLEIVIRYKPKDIAFETLIDNDDDDSESDHHIAFQRVEKRWYERTFWGWDNYLDYVNCLLMFTSVIGVLYIFLHPYSMFIEALGFLSLGLESTLPVPQLLTNFKHRNTDGFSLLILASWFLGDGFKAFYFFYNHSPIQFVACALIQLSFDTIIVFQLILFSPRVKKWLGIESPIALPTEEEEEA